MTLNRPQARNALNLDALRRLAEAYTELTEDGGLRCGVVRAEGSTFCAGLDLADVIPEAIRSGSGSYLEAGQRDPFRMYAEGCEKPIIVAVHGRCFTAGLELVLAADICIAAAGSEFGQQETTRGIMPMGGATFRLPRAIGWAPAMNCMLAGGRFSAEQAAAWGLVTELCPAESLDEVAFAVAERVASCAPLAVQAALRNARLGESQGLPAAIEDVRVEARRICLTDDAREGMASLLEKRVADFLGR